jgi:cephalosporin hydroxylase
MDPLMQWLSRRARQLERAVRGLRNVAVQRSPLIRRLFKPRLSVLFKSHTGKLSDKWDSYLTTYQELFAQFRGRPISLLEIGVKNGGSLEIWSKYFVNARHFVGCDINPDCEKLRYSDARAQVIVGDATSESVAKQVRSISEAYELIIDDGSHQAGHIIDAFVRYFPLLAPGGIYVVEDMHCMYGAPFQGGLLLPSSAQEFFKLVVELVNYEHWQEDSSVGQLFERFFCGKDLPAFLAQGWIDGVEFRNSVVIIRKAKKPTHKKLGVRWIVGTEATVVPDHLIEQESLDSTRWQPTPASNTDRNLRNSAA